VNKTYVAMALIGVALISLWVAADSVLIFRLQPPLNPPSNAAGKTPNVNIMLYGGMVTNAADGGPMMGFGFSPNNITSPGPTLIFKITDVVNITVENVGMTPHAFAVTSVVGTGAPVLFNAEVASASNPLMPGQSGSVVFTPTQAGSTFFYECPCSSHSELGMWGSVVVTG